MYIATWILIPSIIFVIWLLKLVDRYYREQASSIIQCHKERIEALEEDHEFYEKEIVSMERKSLDLDKRRWAMLDALPEELKREFDSLQKKIEEVAPESHLIVTSSDDILGLR